MKKRLLGLLIVIMVLFVFSETAITSYAMVGEAEVNNIIGERLSAIEPLNSDSNWSKIVFVVDADEAFVTVSYNAKEEGFSQIKISVKIQKKILGLFWKTVDIGILDNEWVAYSSDVSGEFYNSFPVDGTGVYRAVVTLKVINTDGTYEEIEKTVEYDY